VDVRDLGVPPRRGNSPATIALRVLRNQRTPSFSNLPAAVSLNQTTPRDTLVFQVEGTDEDETDPFGQLTYSIVGDDNAGNYFTINDQGQVTVRGDLNSGRGSDVTYKVSCSCLFSDIIVFYSVPSL